jgi:hypothetical protein
MPKKSSKLTLKEISNLSQYELGKMSKKELQAAYRDIRQAVQRREKVFKKHGAEGAVPKSIRELKAPSKLNKKDLIKSIAASGNFYQSKRGTYTGMIRELKEITKINEERTHKKISIKDLPSFGEFMKNAQEIMGELYNPAYPELAELWEASKNKNMDPRELLKNYEYWLDREHMEKLRDAKPIKRDGEVLPSDYVKTLGLPEIEGWSPKHRD